MKDTNKTWDMKSIAVLLLVLMIISCNGSGRADNDGDTLSSVRRDVDTIVDRVTDKVDSVTELILDSAKAKGPRLLKKGEKAVKDALDSTK